jgi:dTMP kinase
VPGFFVVLEGIDGAGKSVQVDLLRRALEARGERCVVSREPTDGPWGRRIRESAGSGRMSPEEELRAFIEDRRQHVREVIGPALAEGKTVILDRYFYSSIAYQGSRGAGGADVRARMEAMFPIPDLVLILDVDPAVSLRRIAERRGARPDEFEKGEELERVRAVFLSLAGGDIRVIDGSLAVEEVHRRVIGEVEARRSRAAV